MYRGTCKIRMKREKKQRRNKIAMLVSKDINSQTDSGKPKKNIISLTIKNLGGIGPIYPIIILCLFLSIVSPYFLTLANIRNVLLQSSVLIVLAIAETIIIITGGIDLSVGSSVALITSLIAGFSAYGIGLSLIGSLLIGTFIGFLNGFMVSRLKLPAFIATLGSMGIVRGVALLYTNGLTLRIHIEGLKFFGSGSIGSVPIAVIISLILWFIFQICFTRTCFGRYTYAVGGNMEAARLAGINVYKHLLIIYTLAGLLASIAGVMEAGRIGAGSAIAGQGYELDAIAATVIGGTSLKGGRGTIIGSVLGAVLIGILRNGLSLLNISSFWTQITVGALIILAVTFDIFKERRRLSSF